VSEEDAQCQIEEDIEILARIAKRICLPYTLLVRTEWDKFPGAHYTVGIDTSMPNGRTLQMGSIHHYRTNFSIPYNITYEDENGEHKHVHQTTFGMSERLVGALIGVHGDDKGLVMPPGIAPIQAVIIPIISKNSAQDVAAYCARLRDRLSAAGVRTKLDDRDARPGSKYYDWEIKGVPVRLEVGARDIENGVVSFCRRDTGEKGTISSDSVEPGVKMLLDVISESMLAKAEEVQKSRVQDIDSLEGIPEDKILRFGWCGSAECGHKFEDEHGFKILGTPYVPEPFHGRCIICGAETDKPAYAAHTM
jgi:prolyl-tRNA synthetase